MPRTHELELARLRIMTPEEKLRVADGLWQDARRLTKAAIVHRHPDWSDAEILQETRRVMSGVGA